jgi:hypothetical protein
MSWKKLKERINPSEEKKLFRTQTSNGTWWIKIWVGVNGEVRIVRPKRLRFAVWYVAFQLGIVQVESRVLNLLSWDFCRVSGVIRYPVVAPLWHDHHRRENSDWMKTMARIRSPSSLACLGQGTELYCNAVSVIFMAIITSVDILSTSYYVQYY